MRIKPLLLSLPLGSILAGGVLVEPAIAQEPVTAASTQPPAAQVTPLTIRDVYDKVVAAGFGDIMEIERESDCFEVKAIDPQGKKAKLKVDLVTGEILKSESKAKKEKKDDGDAKKEKDKGKEKKQAKGDQQDVAPAAADEAKAGDEVKAGKEGDDEGKAAAPKDQPAASEPQPVTPDTKAEGKP